jgi:ribosome biogenesis protein UTP30
LRNLTTALPHVVKNIRENWDNVQSIHIKTSSSASLPVWTCRLDEEEGGRWDGLTRVPIPDNVDEEVTKGKKHALESEEEPLKKKKKSGTVTAKPAPVSQAPRPSSSSAKSTTSKESKPTPSATFVKPSNATMKRPESSTQPPSTKEPTKVKVKPARAAAVDFFDSGSPENRSASKTAVSRKSSEPKPSSDDRAPKKPKSHGGKPSETKSILKTSKKDVKISTMGPPAEEKHVKFVAKSSNLKTRRDKALGLTSKKVRSGGGKGVSVKDGVLGKKVAVK